VWSDEGVLAEHRMSETRRHAEGLMDAVDRALLASGISVPDLEGLAVGRGPGSFIGVRTGMATAKGLCLGRGIPLVGLSTLEAMVRSVDVPEGAGLAILDARRGEVFAQLFENRGGVIRAVDPPAALTPDEARARAAGLAFVVGSGLEPHAADTHAAFLPLIAPTVRGLGLVLAGRLADGVVDELDGLVPDYCRPPDAKLPATDPAARRNLAGG
jgi:tRNA threonylcarbamoyladenosine biosynthesis protein TsaB